MHCVSRGGCYLVNSSCDLQEDNQWKRESYEACWLGLVLETRPQYRLTLSEIDSIRRESYKQQQVAHFMVERSPSQMLRLGSASEAMTEHRLPLFSTRKDLQHAKATFGGPVQPVLPGKEIKGGDKEKMTAGTQNLNKPIRVDYRASSLMASPRELSNRVQRRE